jgi:hypothetical protein
MLYPIMSKIFTTKYLFFGPANMTNLKNENIEILVYCLCILVSIQRRQNLYFHFRSTQNTTYLVMEIYKVVDYDIFYIMYMFQIN